MMDMIENVSVFVSITIAYETVITTRNSKSDTLDNKGNDVVVSYSHFQWLYITVSIMARFVMSAVIDIA